MDDRVLPKEKLPAEHDAPQDRRRAPRRKAVLQLTRGNRELETALRISQSLSQHSRLEDLIVQTLESALQAVDAESGSILLADPGSRHLVCYRSIGDKPVPPGSAVPWEHGIASDVFKSAQHAVIVDGEQDAQLPDRIDKSTGSPIRNMIILPLKRWQGEPIGVMEILNKRQGRLNDDDVAVLTMICSLATPAIEEARFFEAKKLAEVAQLAGDMSHDIKNLLMPVLCGSEVLKDEIDELFRRLPDQDSPQSKKSRAMCHEVLDMVQEDVRRISDRVRELADCVKGMSAPPNFALCRITNVVENVYRTLGLMARQRNSRLRAKASPVCRPLKPTNSDSTMRSTIS